MFQTIPLIVMSVVVLGILVFVHELGHFAVAKLCGVGVVEFAIGFGRKIYRRKIGETHYSIGLIPLGGYVRMCGEDPFENAAKGDEHAEGEAKSAARLEGSGTAEWMDQEDLELLKNPAKWFLNKPLWAKALIVLAGPAANLIFAWMLAVSSFLVYGIPVSVKKPVIGDVIQEYPAAKAGIQPGDVVRFVDGKRIISWRELYETVRSSEGRELTLDVLRTDPVSHSSKIVLVRVTGILDTAEMRVFNEAVYGKHPRRNYKIGIMPKTERRFVGARDAIRGGSYSVWYISKMTIGILRALAGGSVSPSKVVGGPISVFSGAVKSAKKGAEYLIDFMVLLGVSLCIFNLLPIPVLDGGHLLFFAVEAVLRRPVPLKAKLIANQVGMALLIFLMAYALSNDVIRLL